MSPPDLMDQPRTRPSRMATAAPVFPPHAGSWLMLDFDGTLVDIAARPDDVIVPDRATDLLSRAMLRLDGRVALVSGRAIDALVAFLPRFDGTIIGAHGAEIRRDGHHETLIDIDLPTVSRLHRIVDDFAAMRPEFLVEHKPTGVVLHYRQAEALESLAQKFMESLAAAADAFRLQPARMAFELKPDGIGKDIALSRLLEKEQIAVYAGDDLTDEPALDLVQDRGGCAIKIGEADSVARYRLSDPAALIDQLERWLD